MSPMIWKDDSIVAAVCLMFLYYTLLTFSDTYQLKANLHKIILYTFYKNTWQAVLVQKKSSIRRKLF